MATMKGLTQYIGPTAALAGGGAGSTWTYNHQQNIAANCIQVLNAQGQPLPPSVVAVTTNSAAQIIISAAVAQAAGVTLRIEWTAFSPMAAASLPGNVGVIS